MKSSGIKILVKGFVGVAMCVCALGAFAAEKEQVAYGVKWTYLVSNGKAIITDNSKWVKHPQSPVAIKIPATLGGCPVEKIRKYGLQNLKVNDGNVRQLIIPEGVVTIEGSLGLGSDYSAITSISLPKTLRVIGQEAFRKTFMGTQLTLPEGLESIGKGAFWACDKMTSIKIPDSVKDIGEQAFELCPIKTANIPKQIKVIPRGLFKHTELENITLHDDITEIGNYAFSHTKLKSVRLPGKLRTIGNCAFMNAKLLEKIEIPNGVTSIGGYAFEGCPNLEEVSIPQSVNSIGVGAFAGWKNLTSVSIPAGFKKGITDIFAYPFTSDFGRTNYQGGHDVPPGDIFTFTGSSSASSTSSRKGPDDDDSDLSDVVGDYGDDLFVKVGLWMDKMWNEHTEAVCWGGVALVILMLIGSIKNAKKKDKKE